MTLLPRRFERLKSVLSYRMPDLTILLESVEKPHNLSAIMRTCDAVGVLEAHLISDQNKVKTFNSTAQGSQKWVRLKQYDKIETAANELKRKGFKLFGTNLGVNAIDYRKCDYTGPTVFVLGAEKWGLSESATDLMDQAIFIPMRGMVQSLNVSVAAATLLYEALRQRESLGLLSECAGSLSKEQYAQILFEWAYPEVAEWCKEEGRDYPQIDSNGQILEELPRTIRLPH